MANNMPANLSQSNGNGGIRAGMSNKLSNLKKNPKVRGVAHAIKKQTFTRKAAQRNLRAMAKVVGGAAGATVGIAAGVATGDFSNVAKYGAAGLIGGAKGAGGLVNKGFNTYDGAKNSLDGFKDDYNVGAYGEEYAQNAKFDREFRRTKEYKDMIKNYPGQEQDVQAMLDSGITDASKMNTILKNMKKYPQADIKHGIAYNNLADACNDSVLYDDKKLRMFLNKRGINPGNSSADLDKLRQSIVDFK